MAYDITECFQIEYFILKTHYILLRDSIAFTKPVRWNFKYGCE